MSAHRTLLALAAVVALAAVAAGAAVAPAETGHAAAKRITPEGVGGVKLGRSYTRLRRLQLIGRIRRGCELGGPQTRSAALRRPLKGRVNFTLSSPRKVTDISLTGGARARGIGIGGTILQIRTAYPRAKVDHGTDRTFGVTLVKVPRTGGGRLTFAVDTKTKRVTVIGIPFVAFCE